MTIEQFLTWFDEVVEPTERIIRLVPPESLEWRLTPTSFSLGQLIKHIPAALRFGATVLRGDKPPLKNMREILISNRRHARATVEESVLELRTSFEEFKASVRSLGEDRFQSGEIDTPQFGKTGCWRYATFMVEHHIHHLMELHLNLKVLGVKVHTGTLYWAGAGGIDTGPPRG